MLLAFWLATFVQLIFWIVLFGRLAFKMVPALRLGPLPPLSVVICARNEAANLSARLPAVLGQDYPDFEVIVVDHASTDDTAGVLQKLSARFPHLKIITCPDERPGKKIPLALGIAQARREWVVLTDADCRPAGPDWLRRVAAKIEPSTEVILGYGPLEKRPGVLNAFARFETAMTAIQYFSYALAGIPYMGVGRNLAYRKAALRRLDAGAHRDLLSGDDDLSVNALAHAGNAKILIHPDSFCWSPAPERFGAFFRQKSRHLSASPRYKPLHKMLLGAWALGFLGHYALGVLAVLGGNWAAVLLGYGLRQILIFFLFFRLSHLLKVQDLRWKLPLLDLSLFVYYLILAPTIWWGPQKKWG